MYEITEKPLFNELEIEVYLTSGQTDIVQRFKIAEIVEGVKVNKYWRDSTGTIQFLAPKLTEILTVLKGIDLNTVAEWERKSVKGKITRTINALDQSVNDSWARATNHYAGNLSRARAFAESEVPTLTPVLVCGQYGFKWEAHQDGRSVYLANVTIAPVPFISLDGTPTIEWVCDTGGFYLSMNGDDSKRKENENRYGTPETAIERGKAMLEGIIADRAIQDLQDRKVMIAKLEELKVNAFIKVQAIA